MKDSWRKSKLVCACWREQKEESFWHRIQTCVVALITLHPLMHISKHEMDFFWIKWGGEKLEMRRVSHMCMLKHRISPWFGESFYKSNSFNLEHLLSYFVPLLICYFMDNFFGTFADLSGCLSDTKTSPHARMHDDQHLHEEVRYGILLWIF